MAILSINGKGYTIHGYDIRVDGTRIRDLKSISINLEKDYVNEATITFEVDKIEMNADTLMALKAIAIPGDPDE